jgi:hypothetical protein
MAPWASRSITFIPRPVKPYCLQICRLQPMNLDTNRPIIGLDKGPCMPHHFDFAYLVDCCKMASDLQKRSTTQKEGLTEQNPISGIQQALGTYRLDFPALTEVPEWYERAVIAQQAVATHANRSAGLRPLWQLSLISVSAFSWSPVLRIPIPGEHPDTALLNQ